MEFSELIAKIGKGQKTSKDLTWEEAKQAMRLLVEGKATPAQVGAFLLSMRMKVESVAELAACTAAAREYVSPLRAPKERPLVDLPCYAGKRDTFHAAIGAALVASAAGAAVLMHGQEGIPGRPGPGPVLAQLGLPVELDATGASEALARSGFAYVDIALYHPPLGRLLDLRHELGVRTIVQPIAKLLNPARAKSVVIGLTHPPYLDKFPEVLKMLGTPRGLILRGVEGDPELSIASVTKLTELRDDRTLPLSLAPKDANLPPGTPQDMAGFPAGQAEREAALLTRILRNEVPGGPRDWVVFNAALLLYAAGLASSIAAGVPTAANTLVSGAAAKHLDALALRPAPATP